MSNQKEHLEIAFKNLHMEMNRLRRNNLRLRLYMEILTSTPACRTAEILRKTYGTEVSNESLIHLN
jgi:hypothetical protein